MYYFNNHKYPWIVEYSFSLKVSVTHEILKYSMQMKQKGFDTKELNFTL